MKSNLYTQHTGKVLEADSRIKHIMAIALLPDNRNEGVARCIVSRVGDVAKKGFIDRSVLHRIHGTDLDHFLVGEPLIIKNTENILAELTPPGWDCIGLEDPDFWKDPETGLLHMYCTIPVLPPNKMGGGDGHKIKIHLGHAVGKGLDSLEMTMPVLLDEGARSAKELSIAPVNSKGIRYNLVESRDRSMGTTYSVVHSAIVNDMGKNWKYDKIVFHPYDHKLPWIGGHASPGPLLPKSFLDIGGTRLVGFMNGREANIIHHGEVLYGTFSVGLFIYDYEKGVIEWVSPEKFIQDTEARTITFASQFIETGPHEGILYAHVDDSFVRAYTIRAEDLWKALPK